jgi:hypothetical protein
MIEHLLPKLSIDPFMMWHLYHMNHVWHKCWESFEWHTLNIVKHHVFYRQTIAFKAIFETTFAI